MDYKFKSKWENNSLIFDKDCGYDGISWRQRNFMCNFCKKEYKSAQALGGHMNVHRRDRARLRLSSPSHDQPNPNPNFSSPPSSKWCLPYKTYHSSLFPISSPSSTTSKETKEEKLPMIAHPSRNFLGDTRKTVDMEGSVADANGGFGGNYGQENECRVWKKREAYRMEMEMGLLKDGNMQMDLDLDLELRLGRS